MEKRKCPDCRKEVEVEETEIKGKFKFLKHWRYKTHASEEFEENVHLRNITDEVCPGSGKIEQN